MTTDLGATSGETVASLCRRYRQLLPATVTASAGRIVLFTGANSGSVSGLVMPSALERQVRPRLAALKLLGPVIAHLQSGRCTVLTEPPDGSEYEATVALLNLNASVAADWIVLPSPQDECSGFRSWIVEPRNAFRPPMCAVIEVMLQVSREGHPTAAGGRR
ncbi:hypothetical protein ACW2Q0_21285 [Nocardia sp. R16R-3T]